MTYIDYLNNFNQWLETNPLPASSQLMYFKLLNIFNRAGWPDEVGVDNLRLQMMLDGAAKTTVVRARDKLVEAGFITYRKGRKGAPNRYALGPILSVYATENATVYATENATVYATENATHIKTKTKTKKPSPNGEGGVRARSTRFTPPTLEEVATYVRERGSSVDPQGFIDFYASKGWLVGKAPMKDWKAACRNAEKWERWSKPAQSGGRKPDFQPTQDRIQKNNDWLDEFLKEQEGGG